MDNFNYIFEDNPPSHAEDQNGKGLVPGKFQPFIVQNKGWNFVWQDQIFHWVNLNAIFLIQISVHEKIDAYQPTPAFQMKYILRMNISFRI